MKGQCWILHCRMKRNWLCDDLRESVLSSRQGKCQIPKAEGSGLFGEQKGVSNSSQMVNKYISMTCGRDEREWER